VRRRDFLLLSSLLLAGCHASARSLRTLRFAVHTDYKSMDPAIGFDADTLGVLRLLHQGLLDCDDDMKLVPWLAADMPTVSDDRRVYTFRIKPEVRFANGRTLEAADFVWSMERVLDPTTKAPGEGYLRNIRGARDFQKARAEGAGEPAHVVGLSTPDPLTLRIELEQPDLAFPWVLTLPFCYAVPREEVERAPDEFSRRPVGSGPFVLKEWRRDRLLRMERNPYYHSPEEVGYDALEIHIGYDDLTQTMMFERGEQDLLMIVPRPDFPRLTRDPRWRPYVRELRTSETQFLVMNCEMEPFNDARVRRAVCHAVDRERIVRVLNGRGVPARGLIPPGVPNHDPGRPGYRHDPALARRLLAEAGRPDGFSATLWLIADGDRWIKIGEVVQQDLKAVGIKIELKPVAFAVHIDATARRGNVPFALSGWTEDYPDPGDFLGPLCDGTKIVDDQCNNCAFYNNPTVNDLIHAGAVETDESRRLDLYRRAEDLVLEDAPYGVLHHPIDYRICQPWVKGFVLHPMWLVRLEKLRLERP
jgi:ABC-type transport system substrate-binding protein